MSKLKAVLCGSGSGSISPENDIRRLLRNGAFILDVRTKMEARKGMAPGAVNIPLLRLKRHLDELPHDRTVVTYCGNGERAGKAKDTLEAAGFQAANAGGYAGILNALGRN